MKKPTANDSLQLYRAKRNFFATPEPHGHSQEKTTSHSFVVQKHWARRLHYDFRLELDGVMKSWAVPKGPSLDPKDKRMAVHVEDHPISYNNFEGQIPEKQYGAGKVIIWDKGTWTPMGDAHHDYLKGHLKFELHGHKLNGIWVFIRMKSAGEKNESWLLIKENDAYARPASEFSVVDEMPDSVAQLNVLPFSKRNVSLPARAVKAELPSSLMPQLATLVKAPPDEADWLYEIKFDGYRLLTRIEGKKIQLFTRNGHDWSVKLPNLIKELAKLKMSSAWLDGEIIVADKNGIPRFQLLQNAFDMEKTQQIKYYLFDLPYYDGYDLRAVPLIERRLFLQSVLRKSDSDVIRYSDNFEAPIRDILSSACRLGLEGLIGKQKDSVYVSRRSRHWIKLKCIHRQEFVIGGFTEPKGSRKGIGSLLLGVYDDEGNLMYAGNVGTGFNEESLTALRKKLDAVKCNKNPFSSETDIRKQAHWVKPVLLAEVSFGEWTQSGRIRHSVFHGLRTDKTASGIVHEKSLSETPPSSNALQNNFKISHGDRVIDKSTGLTKLDLIRYYDVVSPLMMPHLKNRPVSLVRAPNGIDGQLFFQKHMETPLNGIALLSKAIDPNHAPLIEIAKPQGLLSAAQMNVIEFHTWNAVKTAPDKPDRMIFDIDPGEGVTWERVLESTLLLHSFLMELGLSSFVKTSGGKGLHVVLPLKKQYGWDVVKDFSHAIVKHIAKTLPARFVAKSGPKNRIGKIFIDYLRNGFGATTVALWSVRSRHGLTVSVPIAWDEVEKLRSSGQWTITNVHTRFDQGNTPWQAYKTAAQNITHAMKLLNFKPNSIRQSLTQS